MNARVFLVVCAVQIGFAQGVWAALTLVEDGNPRATIVVARDTLGAQPDPGPDTMWLAQPGRNKVAAAARDLQSYLEKMSGAKLTIVSDDQNPAGSLVLVGRSKLTEPFDDLIPSGITPEMREEGLLILCRGDRLVLAGNDEGPYHGTEYAVADFLNRLGVRWFMPGDYGEVVPQRATVQVQEMEVRESPDFICRNWWGPKTAELHATHYRWKIRNKMNPVLDFLAAPRDNTACYLIPAGKAKETPALVGQRRNGTPYPDIPNLSNPEAVQVAAETIKKSFRKNPQETSYGFGPDDGLPRDWTPETVKRNLGFPDLCGRLGVAEDLSASEEWIEFVNAVAREVKKEFPDHLIGTNGYANRNTPPQGVEIDPNLYIMFAAIWSDTLHAYDDPKSWQAVRQGQMLKGWAELCPRVYVYNYLYIMLASAGTPVPLTRKLARDFPLMKQWGVIGFSDEGRSVLAESGIQCGYLRAKLEWDADLDVEAALSDYFGKWYGKAADPARAFWDALEGTLEQTRMLGHEDRILPYVYSRELIAALERDVAEAKRLADTPAAEQHVRADELILEHLKGYMAMTEAEWAGNFAEAARQADYMLAQRKLLSELSPFYCQADDATLESGFYYWGLVARRDYYQKLADRVSGKTGDLILLLPDTARFRLDPKDEGRFAGWYRSDHDDADWTRILTTAPFYIQVPGCMDETGYPYMGNVWYRSGVDVPADAAGKKVMLYAPTVETEAWVWVNGKFVGHRPYVAAWARPNEIDMDVTDALRPGAHNVIAIRVSTGLNAAQAAGGFCSRLFLYSRK